MSVRNLVSLVDSLGLSWRCVTVVRFGLHGLSSLCDQTLPPGYTEVIQQDETREKQTGNAAVFVVQDSRSLIGHCLSHQLVDLSPVF